MLRKKLVEKCIESFRQYRLARNDDPDCVYLTKQWPVEFDIEDTTIIPHLKLAELKDQLKTTHGQSIDKFIE